MLSRLLTFTPLIIQMFDISYVNILKTKMTKFVTGFSKINVTYLIISVSTNLANYKQTVLYITSTYNNPSSRDLRHNPKLLFVMHKIYVVIMHPVRLAVMPVVFTYG